MFRRSRPGDESEEEGPQLSGSSDGDAPKPLSNSGAELQVDPLHQCVTLRVAGPKRDLHIHLHPLNIDVNLFMSNVGHALELTLWWAASHAPYKCECIQQAVPSAMSVMPCSTHPRAEAAAEDGAGRRLRRGAQLRGRHANARRDPRPRYLTYIPDPLMTISLNEAAAHPQFALYQ